MLWLCNILRKTSAIQNHLRTKHLCCEWQTHTYRTVHIIHHNIYTKKNASSLYHQQLSFNYGKPFGSFCLGTMLRFLRSRALIITIAV